MEKDVRWGLIYNLYKRNINISFTSNEFTIEIWIRFNKISDSNNIFINNNPLISLISVSDFEKYKWYQIIITNKIIGSIDTVYKVYINTNIIDTNNTNINNNSDNYMDNNNKITSNLINEFLTEDSTIIGCINIYNRILTNDEMIENYYNKAPIYHGLDILRPMIDYGLIYSNFKFIKNNISNINMNKNMNKCNCKNNYNENNYNENNNYLRNIRNDIDDKVSCNNKPNIGIGEKKTKLLLRYLKNDPNKFVELLNSDILSVEQLTELLKYINNNNINVNNKNINYNIYENFVNYTDNTNNSNNTTNNNNTNNVSPDVYNAVTLLYNLIHKKNNKLNTIYNKIQRINSQLLSESESESESRNKSNTNTNNANNANNANTTNNINKITKTNRKEDKFLKLLEKQTELLGLILNSKNGDCVGHINRNGNITEYITDIYTDNNKPLKILMNPRTYLNDIENINANKIDNSDKFKIGQCINNNGNSISYITSDILNKNHKYIPIKESKIDDTVPIIALITQYINEKKQKPKKKLKIPTSNKINAENFISTNKSIPLKMNCVNNKNLNYDWLMN